MLPARLRTSARPNPGVQLALVLLLFFMGISCGPGIAGNSRESLVITGSSTLAPMVAEIAGRFEEYRPDIRVDVQAGGSSRGLADLRQQVASIAMVSRDLGGNEQNLTAFPIAQDGISVILNQKNPIQDLTSAQIRAVYSGEISNWKDLQGLDRPITVINKAEGRATLEVFLNFFELANSQIDADVVIGDNEQAVKLVAGNADSIAYVSVGTAERDIMTGVPIKLVSVDGIEASSDSVASGQLPMNRTLNLVTAGPPRGLVREFLEFALSSQNHELIRAQSFVPVTK